MADEGLDNYIDLQEYHRDRILAVLAVVEGGGLPLMRRW